MRGSNESDDAFFIPFRMFNKCLFLAGGRGSSGSNRKPIFQLRYEGEFLDLVKENEKLIGIYKLRAKDVDEFMVQIEENLKLFVGEGKLSNVEAESVYGKINRELLSALDESSTIYLGGV